MYSKIEYKRKQELYYKHKVEKMKQYIAELKRQLAA
jgi:hypothetical protein